MRLNAPAGRSSFPVCIPKAKLSVSSELPIRLQIAALGNLFTTSEDNTAVVIRCQYYRLLFYRFNNYRLILYALQNK